jgi:hypothetical protein
MTATDGRAASEPSDVGSSTARALVAELGGRYSTELGIDLEKGGGEIERWFLAATLFGSRISASVAMRTYGTLASAGIATGQDVEGWSWERLVEQLDAGGYARYDYRMASRLHALAGAVRDRLQGRVESLAGLGNPRELEAALDALPGWGPVTVRLFLRELRGIRLWVWPATAGGQLSVRGAVEDWLDIGRPGPRWYDLAIERARRAESCTSRRGRGLPCPAGRVRAWR